MYNGTIIAHLASGEMSNPMCQSDTTNRTKQGARKSRSLAVVAADDGELRSFLSSTLRQSGYEVIEIADSLALFSFLSNIALSEDDPYGRVDLVVSDIAIPGKTSLDVLREFKRVVRGIPVVLITTFDDKRTWQAALDMGATAVFDKPFNIDEFKSFLAESVAREL